MTKTAPNPMPPSTLDASVVPDLSPDDARKVAGVLAPFSPRRQNFIRSVVAGNPAPLASRAAGYTGNSKLTAQRLLAEPAIAKAIEDLRAVFANRALYDFEQAHNVLVWALDFSKKTNNANAAVRAAEALAKLHGFMTDKLDVTAQGGVSFVFPSFARKSEPEPTLIEGEATENA